MSALRDLLLHHIDVGGTAAAELTRLAVAELGVTRQAVHSQLKRLVDEGVLVATADDGETRKYYSFAVVDRHHVRVPLTGDTAEDEVWDSEIGPHLPSGELTREAREVLHYAFTEMMNNAIDHSEGTSAVVSLAISTGHVRITISDDGVGIFAKIAKATGLRDERYAILELAKGKLTTQASRHSGEGIFFTSRAVDSFVLASGSNALVSLAGSDFLLDRKASGELGTSVAFTVRRDRAKGLAEVFDEYQDGDLSFMRTKVPVSLAIVGEANLVSRSQAKRLLARFDRFREVILDFHGVESIGQGFADEVFRVFVSMHPEVKITHARANSAVVRMIRHVTAGH